MVILFTPERCDSSLEIIKILGIFQDLSCFLKKHIKEMFLGQENIKRSFINAFNPYILRMLYVQDTGMTKNKFIFVSFTI